jgi:hypothetical protein
VALVPFRHGKFEVYINPEYVYAVEPTKDRTQAVIVSPARGPNDPVYTVDHTAEEVAAMLRLGRQSVQDELWNALDAVVRAYGPVPGTDGLSTAQAQRVAMDKAIHKARQVLAETAGPRVGNG